MGRECYRTLFLICLVALLVLLVSHPIYPRLPTLQVTPRALTLLSSLPPPEPGHDVRLVRVIIFARRMHSPTFLIVRYPSS